MSSSLAIASYVDCQSKTLLVRIVLGRSIARRQCVVSLDSPNAGTTNAREVAFSECFDPVNARQVVITSRILTKNQDSSEERLPVESVSPPIHPTLDSACRQSFITTDGTALILLTGKDGDCLIPSREEQTSIFAYSISRGEWQELLLTDAFYPGIPETSNVGSPREKARKCGHEMAFDSVSGRCLLYGGRTDDLGTLGNLAAELVLCGCVLNTGHARYFTS